MSEGGSAHELVARDAVVALLSCCYYWGVGCVGCVWGEVGGGGVELRERGKEVFGIRRRRRRRRRRRKGERDHLYLDSRIAPQVVGDESGPVPEAQGESSVPS